MSTRPLSARSLREADQLLAQPFAHEDFGLHDEPVFSVFVDPNADPTFDRTKLKQSLAAVPAVTVAVLAAADAPPAALADTLDAFDVVLATDSRCWPQAVSPVAAGSTDIDGVLADLVDAIVANPIAAMTLVQLLRASASLSIRDALVAESLAYATLQAGPEFGRWLADHPARPTNEPAHSNPADGNPGPAVLVRRDATNLELVLNRPARHNAFSAAMRDELVLALRVAEADPTLGSVTISGRGRSFCAGGDLDEFGCTPSPAEGHRIRMVRSAAWWIHAISAPVTFLLHGACVGAGIELPSFGNTVLASSSTFFRLPEVGMGLVPGAGGTVSIPRKIGRQRSAWLALTGKTLSLDTAKQWRLVDELVESRSDE